MFKTRLLSGIVLVIILIATVGTGGGFTVWISGTDQSDRTVRAL